MSAPNMNHILARIPVNWGRELRFYEGWNQLVFDLDEKLAEIDPDYTIAQAKEKFGGLRFYVDRTRCRRNNPEDEEFFALIRQAEILSERTCEICGAPGALRSDKRWIQTLCDEDNAEADKALERENSEVLS